MSIEIYYKEYGFRSFNEVLHRVCKCGHQLYQHGYVFHEYEGEHLAVTVSQCVICDCKEFSSCENKDVN